MAVPMDDRTKTVLKRLLVLPPVLIGGAVLAWQIGGHDAPEQAPPDEPARLARVITVNPVTFVPRAVGFGHVEPGTVWRAVAQVSGEIVYRHPDLEAGKPMADGTAILRIDPADYELAVDRIQATLASDEAELADLAVEDANTRASLAIERRSLALADEDLGRKRTLRRSDDVSQAAVDEAERTLLTQRQRVQELDNALRRIPARRQVLEASRALNQAQLAEAQLDLARTEVRIPFNARISDVHVEERQFVSVGEEMVVADSIDVAEVAAQIPAGQMMPLFRDHIAFADRPPETLGGLFDELGIRAIVRFRVGDRSIEWTARVDRVNPELDPTTRTVGVVAAVDQPYRQAVLGERPPLIKNMYVRVEILGQPRPDSIVVPRVAVRRDGDRSVVYVVDGEERLRRRVVIADVPQADMVRVADGLVAGDRVVVSDLIPAIEGMRLEPTEDADLAGRLATEAAGPDVQARRQ